MHKGSLMQKWKTIRQKERCKNRFLSSTWRWPPRVETCCSNFNLHNYSCVDGNFYVIYNKLNDFHTTGWILLVVTQISVHSLAVQVTGTRMWNGGVYIFQRFDRK